ncbi:hypothetical protein EB001_08155 [bacterium]|nr:hypothetical protein [bacterium]
MRIIEIKTPTLQQRMAEFEKLMRLNGYRFLTREDIVEGAEFLCVDVERYFSHPPYAYRDPTVCSDQIKLDEKPIRKSKLEDKVEDYVFYHTILPVWDGQCFVTLKHFLATGYLDEHMANDHRFIVKRK